ncbi:unnamed protein product, partial [Didymodactylos carnosus]
MTGDGETAARARKAKKAAASIAMVPKMSRNFPVDIATPYMVLKSRCALCINKIGLVQMAGEYGSRIQDDTRTNAILNDARYLTVTVYEETMYQLHVQLDCGGQPGGDPSDNPCSRSLSVSVWIDFDNNGLDDAESRALRRSWSNNDIPNGAYDLGIHIPSIDGRNTKSENHRMRLTVMPTEEYQRDCGNIGYKETRDYT